MKSLDYVSKKLGVASSEALQNVITYAEQGKTLGEACYDPTVRADKDFNYWKVDKVYSAYEDFQRLEQKKIKCKKDIQTRQNPPEGVVELIEAASTLEELDETFRPYKRKKKTKATLAREAGLQGFADLILSKAQSGESFDSGLETEAKKYIQPSLGFITYETVLKGVQDILVEQVLSQSAELRKELLSEALKEAKIIIKPGEKFTEGGRYSNFVKAPVQKSPYYQNPNHFDKFPQIKKGWEENFLKVSLDFDLKPSIELFHKAFVAGAKEGDLSDFLKTCAKKALEIHALPSVTTEIFDSFYSVSQNKYLTKLKLDYISLLTTPALGAKPVLSVFESSNDSAVMAFVSHTGDLVSSTSINLKSDSVVEEIKNLLEGVVAKLELGAVALPLGGASRRLEKFFKRALEDLKKTESLPLVFVDPRGVLQFISSSESKFGLTEKLDNVALSALRLAKRLQDPLFEYADHLPSHLLDVPSFINKETVNSELCKTLSYYLCSLGFKTERLGLGLLKNIGWFSELVTDTVSLEDIANSIKTSDAKEKKDLESKIPAAALARYSKFFKFEGALNLLDQSRVSLDNFSKIKDVAKENEISLLKGPVQSFSKLVSEASKKTLEPAFLKYLDIELSSPFKDFRKAYKVFSFSKSSEELETLQEGNLYWGVVTKFSSFGAFVDIGAGLEGLIHLSELSNEYVGDPRKILRLGQWVLVKAIKIDKESKKLSFSKIQAEVSKTKGSGGRAFGAKSEQSHGSKRAFSKRPQPKKSNFKKSKNFNANKPKRQQQPFNNPFAALQDLNKN